MKNILGGVLILLLLIDLFFVKSFMMFIILMTILGLKILGEEE